MWLFQSSIARKYLFSLLAFLMPITLIGITVNYVGMSAARKEVVASYTNSVNLLAGKLDYRLETLTNLADNLFTNTDLIYINYNHSDGPDILLKYADFLDMMKVFSYNDQLESDVTIHLKDNERTISSKNGLGYATVDERRKIFAMDSALTNRWLFQKDSQKPLVDKLIFIRNPSYSGGENDIVVKIEIDRAQIVKFLESLKSPEEEGNTFLIDPKSEILFASNGYQMNQEILTKKVSSYNTDSGEFKYSINHEEYHILFNKSKETGLIMGMCFLENQIMGRITFLSKLLFTIYFVASIILAFVFTFVSYRSLLFPIHRLVEGMRLVSKGDFKVQITGEHKDELGFMFNQFNTMVSKIDNLINDVYIARLNQQQAKLKLLQSRINPHFLYNCLNFIYQMSMKEDNEGAANMALHLGRYYRYVAKCSKDFVPLKDEIENVENYIHIQKTRFKGRLEYEAYIPDELVNKVVPAMILQPVVENAIIHGIESTEKGISIKVSAKQEDNMLKICVEDDGKGLEEAAVDALKSSLKEIDKEETGVGLNNTHWRLRLHYGDRSGIEIERIKPKGLRVILCISCEVGGEADV